MRPQQNWKRCKYTSRQRRAPARTLYGKPARHHCARTAMPQDGAASLRQGGNAASRRGIIASGRRSMNIPLDHIDVRYSIFATPAFIHPPDCVENPFFSGSIHKFIPKNPDSDMKAVYFFISGSGFCTIKRGLVHDPKNNRDPTQISPGHTAITQLYSSAAPHSPAVPSHQPGLRHQAITTHQRPALAPMPSSASLSSALSRL